MAQKQYSAAFKKQAVKEVKNSSKSQRTIAKELGIPSGTLSSWLYDDKLVEKALKKKERLQELSVDSAVDKLDDSAVCAEPLPPPKKEPKEDRLSGPTAEQQLLEVRRANKNLMKENQKLKSEIHGLKNERKVLSTSVDYWRDHFHEHNKANKAFSEANSELETQNRILRGIISFLAGM